jgi:hypothetical protein
MMKPAEQYEYTHGQVTRPGYVVLDGETEERSFNDMGAQGWMLYPPNGTIAYFYRPVSLVQQIEVKELAAYTEATAQAVDYPPSNPRSGKLPAKPRSRR